MKLKSAPAVKQLDFKVAEFKLSDTGSFSGYASIFGNVDQGGDIVERGAFQKIHTTSDGQVRVLYQHDMRQPIGKAKVQQDDIGLKFDGHLVLGIARARDAHEMMKAGILDGMSIGYDVMPGGAETTNAGIRKLKALELFELSPVTFGMNALARIENVKALEKISTVRELENALRDAGFSVAQAKLIASGKWREASQREAGGGVKEVIARLKGLGVEEKSSVDTTIEKIRAIQFSF